MRAGFGVLEAYAAQFGPSVLARNDPKRCGGGRRQFEASVGTDILGQSGKKSCNSQGMLTSKYDRSSLGLSPPKNDDDDRNGPPPVEDGNDLSEVEYE